MGIWKPRNRDRDMKPRKILSAKFRKSWERHLDLKIPKKFRGNPEKIAKTPGIAIKNEYFARNGHVRPNFWNKWPRLAPQARSVSFMISRSTSFQSTKILSGIWLNTAHSLYIRPSCASCWPGLTFMRSSFRGRLVHTPLLLGIKSRPTMFSKTELFPELCDPIATIWGREIKSELEDLKIICFNWFYNIKAIGIRYYIRWQAASVKTIKFQFAKFWPFLNFWPRLSIICKKSSQS